MNLGKLKVWQERASGYLSILNFFMILFLYVMASPLGIAWYWWLIAISVGTVILLFVDITIIFPQAQVYSADKNPFMVNIVERLERIEKKVSA
jgi:fatty acid desaturase